VEIVSETADNYFVDLRRDNPATRERERERERERDAGRGSF